MLVTMLNPEPESKIKFRRNLMMPQLAKDLDIPFVQNGSLVLCFDESQFEALKNYTSKA